MLDDGRTRFCREEQCVESLLKPVDGDVWFGEGSDKSQPLVLPEEKYSKIRGRQDEKREGRELSSGKGWLCVKKVCLR
jgi:hypothetical protein